MKWDDFKQRFGYGALKEESVELTDAVKTKSRFDAAVSQVVTSLLMQLIIPWIEYCFSKYPEPYFHQKMTEGFDFIQDWKDNHPTRYGKILKAIRAVRNRIILDREKILAVVINELHKRGWTITEWEKDRFRANIDLLISEIYS